jgi:hypothetical protein
MPPPKKKPSDLDRSSQDRWDTGGRGGMPQTRTGNRGVNTLSGGDRHYNTGNRGPMGDLATGIGQLPPGTLQPGPTYFSAGIGGPTFAGRDIDPTIQQGSGGDGGGGGRSAEDDEIDALIAKIMADLDKPLDFNDPLVANILTGARTATLSDLAGRGVYGGYSENQAQQSYINAASSLQDQKQARLLQALSLANQRDLTKAQMVYDQERYEYENDPARGIGSLIGGVVGGVGGGIAGIPGGLPGIVGGAGLGFQAGSQAGAGVGGFFAQKPQMSWGNGGGGSQGWGMPPRRNSLKQY